MSKQDGMEKAVQMALEQLGGVDMAERASLLNLPQPENQRITFRLFGKEAYLDTSDFSITYASDGAPVKTSDQILVLHYLLCDFPVKATGELIPFREFSAGQFYLEPFLSRTVKPLAKRFGNDIESLKCNLNRFDWTPLEMGDLAASINAFGDLNITLIYRLGDDEFPASADVLFDACVRKVYRAEDAAVLASRICIGLL